MNKENEQYKLSSFLLDFFVSELRSQPSHKSVIHARLCIKAK